VKYVVKTRNRTAANGLIVEENTAIASIDTEIDIDQLETLIRFNAIISPVGEITVKKGTEAFETGSVVGKITTEMDVDNVESLIRHGCVMIQPDSGEPIAVRSQAIEQPIPKDLPDVDELNKQDAAADQQAEANKPNVENDRDLSGLAGAGTERIQILLHDAGMKNKADVKAKIADGFDFVAEVDGVGKAAYAKIQAWAEAE
jgi:hypothetical protein